MIAPEPGHQSKPALTPFSQQHATGEIGIALLGCGVVGSGVARLLSTKASDYARRLGRPVRLVGAAVRDLTRARPGLEPAQLTTDPWTLIHDPRVHIVVEVMGGVAPACDLILAALDARKPVVTANKEVLARHGDRLVARAHAREVGLYAEGAVAGGIPILLPIQRSLVANSLSAIYGIVNGTTNYILTRMAEEGTPFDRALAEAQRLGYAEADPTSDVDGHDAAYKAAILAGLLANRRVPVEAVHREGIAKLAPSDFAYARELGYAIKLLAIIRRVGERVDVRVHPTMIPVAHPLAAIRLVTNAVAVKGDAVGEVMFSGPGAGQLPTASAVVADILNAAEHLEKPGSLMAWPDPTEADVIPLSETVSRFYLRLRADDRPGVLGSVGASFGSHGVSIRYFVQKEGSGDQAEMVFVTHPVREGSFRDAIKAIAADGAIRELEAIVRVEEDV